MTETMRWFRSALAGVMIALLGVSPKVGRATDGVQAEATGEFGVMLKMFALEGEARERFVAAVKDWQKEIREWQNSGKTAELESLYQEIRKARESGDRKREAEIESKLRPLNDAYWVMRNRTRAAIIATLTEDQQRKWMIEVLWTKVEPTLKSADVTAEQVGQIKGICEEEVAAYVKARPGVIKEDPYLFSLNDHRDLVVDRARLEVLTEEQRQKVSPRGSAATRKAAKAWSEELYQD